MFNIPEITPEEAKKILESDPNAVLLDVRTPQEYRQVRVPGSVLIPVDDLRFKFKELDKNKKYIVMCRSGNRSAFATYALRQLGFEAFNMIGGILNWPYETERG
jgi:rhodanese-related sulfurtransferase